MSLSLSESSMELSYPGAKVCGNKSSIIHYFVLSNPFMTPAVPGRAVKILCENSQYKFYIRKIAKRASTSTSTISTDE